MDVITVNFKINQEIISLQMPVDETDHLSKIRNDDKYAVDHLFELINTGFIHLREPVTLIQRVDGNNQVEKSIYDGFPLLEQDYKDNTERESVGDSMQEIFENEGLRKMWGYNETLQLIEAVGSHYSDIINFNPKIKRKAWQNILNVLISFKIETTIDDIKKKWSNLIQTYNKTKDLKTRTGRGPSRFQFFENIDNIVGNKPTNSCTFSMDIGSATPTITQTESTSSVSDDAILGEENTSCVATSQIDKRGKKRRNYTMEYFKTKKEYLLLKEKEIEKRAMEKEEEKRKKDEEKMNKLDIEKKSWIWRKERLKPWKPMFVYKKKKICPLELFDMYFHFVTFVWPHKK